MAPSNKKSSTTSDKVLTNQNRARHPKVKTGCITCRIRRVKCDETKPKCMRCCRYGAECGGYLPSRSKNSSNSNRVLRQNRVLIPKLQLAERHVMLPEVNLFGNEIEKQYFNVFSNQIASAMFSYFNCESWVKIIHQACAAHPSIRYAAIALGALGKTHEIATVCKKIGTGERIIIDAKEMSNSEIRLRSMSKDDLEKQADAHHRQALEQYDKAIRIMRTHSESGNHEMRITLIICMILYCFEQIHGNHRSAASQAQTGLALLHEFQSRAQRDKLHPQGYSSPCPDKIEDFIVQCFGRLEIQSMSVFDPRPQELHIKLKNEGKEIIAAMPSSIQTIEQSRNYLDLITRRIMHFNGIIHVPRGNPTAPGSILYTSLILNMPLEIGNLNHNPIPWIELKIPWAQAQSIVTCKALNQEKSEFVAELDAWALASNDLLMSSTKNGLQNAISALTLRIAALKARITILSCLFLNESAYDNLYPEFRQIVQYADQLMTLQKAQKSTARQKKGSNFSTIHMNFSFDIAIIPALYVVMLKCRHGPTRHKAVKLLQENPCREGVWDSVAASSLGAWVIVLEEESARQIIRSSSSSSSSTSLSPSSLSSSENNTYFSSKLRHLESLQPIYSHSHNKDINLAEMGLEIPEEIRVRGAQMRFDLLERKAYFECTQMDQNTGKFTRKKGTHSW